MGVMLAQLNDKDLTVLRDLVQAGKVTPVIDRRYALGDVPEAIRYLEDGHARGKVVITLEPDGEGAPAHAHLAASTVKTTGPGLIALALIAGAVGLTIVPVAVALVLNRRFQRRNPGKRPYRWGYWFSIQSFIAGIGLGILLESGVGGVIACVVYAALAWLFAGRHRWAWITLTLLSFNPAAWIINLIYLRRRWAEDSAPAPAVAGGG
jgi:hypothetical protein